MAKEVVVEEEEEEEEEAEEEVVKYSRSGRPILLFAISFAGASR